MLKKEKLSCGEIISYLLHKEMYLYFPKNDDIYEKITDHKLKIIRKIFHVKKFCDEEEKKLESLKTVLKEYIDKNSDEKLHNFDILRNIYKDKEEMMRYLNYNNYDFYQTFILLKMFNELLFKMNINYKNVLITEKINKILNSGFIYTMGRDKRFRPIIVIDFRKYYSLILKAYESRDSSINLVNIFVYYFNFIIEKMMLPGQIEQFNIIMQIDGMDSSNFLNNFKDIIYLIQMCYPSRLNLMYIVSFKNILETSYSIIENFLLLFNKERTIIINRKKYKDIFKEISREILKDFLEPILSNSKGSNSTIVSNGSDPAYHGANISKIPSTTFYFPPILNNNSIFDKEDEKLDLLMNEDDYIRLMEEDGNKLFYSFNEELFLIKTSIKVKSNKEKDFSKEQNTTLKQESNSQSDQNKDIEFHENLPEINLKKSMKTEREINNYEINIQFEIEKEVNQENFSPPQLASKTFGEKPVYASDKIGENDEYISPVKPSTKVEKSFTFRKSSQNSKNSWKKNLSIIIKDNAHSIETNNLNDLKKSNKQIIEKEIINTSTKNTKKTEFNDNSFIDSQCRGDACCKIVPTCQII